MKSYIDIRVVGHTEELKSLVALLSLIQSFGRYGMSRTIQVHTDGDGSGRLDFIDISKKGEVVSAYSEGEVFESISHEDLNKLEQLKKKFEVWIGE